MSLLKEPRPAAWQRVTPGGERYGPQSRIHSVFTVRYDRHPKFNPNADIPDADVTVCGIPIQSAFNNPFGIWSHRGPVEVVDIDPDNVPLGRMCRGCFPVVKMEPSTGSLFEEAEEAGGRRSR